MMSGSSDLGMLLRPICTKDVSLRLGVLARGCADLLDGDRLA